jgi:hypothetical protein
MGLLDELLKAQKPKRNLMGTQMVKGPDQPYLRQDYPTLYGALGGLLGTAPDEMAGSVLDPNTASVRQGAEYGFPVGTALGVLPMARFTKGLPVGMGIKDVGDDIFKLSKQEFLGKPRITKNANAADLKPKELNSLKDVEPQPFMGGKYQIKMDENGAAVFDKGKPIASYNFGNTLVVDKPYRKSGIAQDLVYEWRTSFPAPAVATERTKASQAIQEKVWERIQNEKQSLPVKKAPDLLASPIDEEELRRLQSGLLYAP